MHITDEMEHPAQRHGPRRRRATTPHDVEVGLVGCQDIF